MSNSIISAFKDSSESYKPHKAKGIKLDHAFLANLCKDIDDHKENDPLPMSVDEALRFFDKYRLVWRFTTFVTSSCIPTRGCPNHALTKTTITERSDPPFYDFYTMTITLN